MKKNTARHQRTTAPTSPAWAADVELLEPRSLFAAAAAYFEDGGKLTRSALPRTATLTAAAGRRLTFSAATLRSALPKTTRSAATLVRLPTPDGGSARFRVVRTQLLAANVAGDHPEIATYKGVGVDDPALTTTFDLTAVGFHATVFSTKGDWAVAPVTEFAKDVRAGGGQYASFKLSSVELPDLALDHDEVESPRTPAADPTAADPTGPTRITVRIALAANGEWTALTGGTTATAYSKIVSNLNYAEGIYNREFNIGFSLVSGTNLIYTNSATDPYTNSDAAAMLAENQTVVDTAIGAANYDIGHVFTTSGGGLSYVGVVGRPGYQAGGVDGNSPQTVGSQFTFAHEMGHQFGSRHTWNYVGNATYDNQRSAADAYEPGNGSTILSYGGFGFAGDFIPSGGRDDYFHARSIEVITAYMNSDTYGKVAGTRTATNNAAPVVSAGVDRTIPAKTPFELTGSATDNGAASALTYGWEQYDLGDADPVGVDDGNGPLFRSRRATATSTRSFPEVADVLANRSDNDEYLPQVSRTADPLTFRLTVRDGIGGVSNDDVDLVVQDTGSAFALTSQNAAVTWARGSTQAVTWNVAGTTAAAFDAANVGIQISYDGGATFATLLASTPNTGSALVTVPAAAPLGSSVRIKVKPLNNVFYDINNANITVAAATAPVAVSSVTVDNNTAQRSRVRSLTVVLNGGMTAVGIAAGAFALGRTDGGVVPSIAVAGVAASGSTTVVTLNFSGTGIVAGSLADGRYRLTVNGALLSGTNGVNIDAAGNGVAGSVRTLDFHRLYGDVDGDRGVSINDFNAFAAVFGKVNGNAGYDTAFDFDGDDGISINDFNQFASRFGVTI